MTLLLMGVDYNIFNFSIGQSSMDMDKWDINMVEKVADDILDAVYCILSYNLETYESNL